MKRPLTCTVAALAWAVLAWAGLGDVVRGQDLGTAESMHYRRVIDNVNRHFNGNWPLSHHNYSLTPAHDFYGSSLKSIDLWRNHDKMNQQFGQSLQPWGAIQNGAPFLWPAYGHPYYGHPYYRPW